MLDTSKMNTKQKILLVTALSAAFILVAVPFKTLSLIPGFSEIRPVNSFIMLFGLLFGVYGALGCAIGNIIADILGGTLAISSWAGVISNFLGAYVAYILWYRIVGKQPRISTFKEVLVFVIITVLIAIMTAVIAAFGVKLSYRYINIADLFIQVILNTVIFSILLGLPLVITAENTYKVTGSVPDRYRSN